MDQSSRSTRYRYNKRNLDHYCNEEMVAGPDDPSPDSVENGHEVLDEPATNDSPMQSADGSHGAHEDYEDEIYWDSEEEPWCWESGSESSLMFESDVEDDPQQESSEEEISDTTENTLQFKLAEWAVNYGISSSAIMALLTILNVYTSLALPKHPMTLLKTPRLSKATPMGDGDYHYFGLKSAIIDLIKKLPRLPSGQKLTLQINIDGIPLFKSSPTSLWPILGMLTDVSKEVFPIALFCGQKKPPLGPYLKDFVTECKLLCENGFTYMGRSYTLALDSLVCDAPARAFLKCTKGHSGYYSCERCEQKGVYHASGRLTLPEMNATERNYQSFLSMRNESHHHSESPLLPLSLDLVKDVPLDYMHLSCLGVMRMMVRLWLAGPLVTRLSATTVKVISERLCHLRSSIPREFARKPRSLNEFRMWKATEFRQFLLYTGMIALRGAVPLEMYELFLLYSSAMCILLSPKLARQYAYYAKGLLSTFVKNFSELFGSQFLVYNVHSLLHLADDAEKHGSLDSISCFPYESYLNRLKRSVRRPTAPIAQIMRRASELKVFGKIQGKSNVFHVTRKHSSGPVPGDMGEVEQFHYLVGPVFVSTAVGDNCVLLDGLHVAVVRNIVRKKNVTYIVVTRFEKQEPFYMYPFDSSMLGIFKVAGHSSVMECVAVQSLRVIQKCILAELNDKLFVAVPVLHSHHD